MDPKYRFTALRRPKKRKTKEQRVDQDEAGTDDQSSVSDSNSEAPLVWNWPDQNILKQQLASGEHQVSQVAQDAWLALIEHKKNSGSQEWSPSENIVEFLLFALYIDITNGITREILQKIIDLLLTLQQHGIVIDMKLPVTALNKRY